MTIDPNQDELDFALSQQRDGAYLYVQALRDCIAIGADVGRALQQHAITLATDRPLTGGPARGGDLTASLDRFTRAMRRTVALASKIEAEIVAHCQAAPTLLQAPAPEPAPRSLAAIPAEPPAQPHPGTRSDPSDRQRPLRPDADRAEAPNDADHDARNERPDTDEQTEKCPDGPIPEMIEDIRRELALADPRQPDPDAAPESVPEPQPGPRWTYQRPPPEAAAPGVLTLDALGRRDPGPSG